MNYIVIYDLYILEFYRYILNKNNAYGTQLPILATLTFDTHKKVNYKFRIYKYKSELYIQICN